MKVELSDVVNEELNEGLEILNDIVKNVKDSSFIDFSEAEPSLYELDAEEIASELLKCILEKVICNDNRYDEIEDDWWIDIDIDKNTIDINFYYSDDPIFTDIKRDIENYLNNPDYTINIKLDD